MSIYAVLLLTILVATAVMAFYWYVKHRQIDLLLRRYEGEHYGLARSRLPREAADQVAGGEPDAPQSITALSQRRMRGLIGDSPSTHEERRSLER
jgi:hypothetical protein